MCAVHDVGIVYGDWVGREWAQREYVKITNFDRYSVSLNPVLSNSESERLLLLPFAR